QPVWDGQRFLVGHELRPVLCYHTQPGHWTPELTAMHEAEAGHRHPIDEASRALTVASFQHFLTRAQPIVLDVGCSSGFLLEALRRPRPDAALVGAGFLLPPLLHLPQRLPGVP